MGMYNHILIDLAMCTELCTSSRDRSFKEVDCRKTTWMFVHRLVLKTIIGRLSDTICVRACPMMLQYSLVVMLPRYLQDLESTQLSNVIINSNGNQIAGIPPSGMHQAAGESHQ